MAERIAALSANTIAAATNTAITAALAAKKPEPDESPPTEHKPPNEEPPPDLLRSLSSGDFRGLGHPPDWRSAARPGTAPLLTTSASVDEYIRSNFGEPIRREGDDGSLSPRRKLSEGHTLTAEELEQLKRIASVADHNASL